MKSNRYQKGRRTEKKSKFLKVYVTKKNKKNMIFALKITNKWKKILKLQQKKINGILKNNHFF